MDAYISNASQSQTVYWNDPNDGACSGQFTIERIESVSGTIESPFTLVSLANGEGAKAKALANELTSPANTER